MTEPTVVCPSCKSEFKLTESLAAPLVEATRRQFEEIAKKREAEVAKREGTLRERQADLAKAEAAMEERLTARLDAARRDIATEEAKKARVVVSTELEQREKLVAELNGVIGQMNAKLAEAQKAQADVMRTQRELDDAKREMALSIEKQVQETVGPIRDQARKDAEDGFRLKVAEKEQAIVSMQKTIEELKRQANKGSEQLQGEVQELELEALLRGTFPLDTMDPVGKGEFGGDVLQRVIGPLGQPCGTILWESKRTKHWSDGWLPKLRDDMRAAGAEVAILITQTLPTEIENFGLRNGVWVTSHKCAMPLAGTLRHLLAELAATRKAGEGQQSKMELVYQYLTGPSFGRRVTAIVEKFTIMREDLDKERKTMTRMWAKREAQINVVLDSTYGMYGDLQGIAGRSFAEIDGLDIKLLPEDGVDASSESNP